MERKDIVLKNLAEELKFNQHEWLRLNKIDQNSSSSIEPNLALDLDKIELIANNLKNILKSANSFEINKLPLQSFGKVLIVSDSSIPTILDLVAKLFKVGNQVTVLSKFANTHSFDHLAKAWKSVLDSQGMDNHQIKFITTNINTYLINKFDIIVTTEELEVEPNFPTRILNCYD